MFNKSEDTVYAKQIIRDAAEMLSGKASDYGGPGKSFSEAAEIATILRGKPITAVDVAGVLVAVKITRLGNLTGEATHKEPEYDTVLNVIQDLINYAALYETLREDGLGVFNGNDEDTGECQGSFNEKFKQTFPKHRDGEERPGS